MLQFPHFVNINDSNDSETSMEKLYGNKKRRLISIQKLGTRLISRIHFEGKPREAKQASELACSIGFSSYPLPSLCAQVSRPMARITLGVCVSLTEMNAVACNSGCNRVWPPSVFCGS